MFQLHKEVAAQLAAWRPNEKGARVPKEMGYTQSMRRAKFLPVQESRP